MLWLRKKRKKGGSPMTRMRYVKMDRIMNHMLIHALREVFRQEKKTGASGGYHTGSGSEAGRAGRGKALPDRSRTQQIRGSLKPAPGHIPEKRTLFRWDRQRPVKDYEIQIPPIPWKGKMKKGRGTNIQKYDTRKNRSHAEKISAGNRGHA